MKSLKISLLGLLLVLTSIVSAKNYDVRTLKPYFSIGGEFRNMKGSELNAAVFDNYAVHRWASWIDAEGSVVDTLLGIGIDTRQFFPKIGTKDPILGLNLGIIDLGSSTRIELFSMGLEAGILWEGIQMGFSFQLTEKLQSSPTQTSVVFEVPFAQAGPVDPLTGEAGDPVDGSYTSSVELWTASFTISDYIFVMGYELFPEESFFQLVPRIGLGFSSINIQPPGRFSIDYLEDDIRLRPFVLQKQDYSALGKSFQLELESRLNFFSRLGLSAGIGYRYTSFDEVKITDKTETEYIRGILQDSDADHLFISAKATVFFKSLYEQETGKPVRRQ